MSLKYQVMLLWAICSMHKVVVSSNEVVLVERNITDSFRVGKDGCRSDTSVCTSSATCQLDTGLCLCKEDSPHFLNYVKENFSQYRCVSTEDMKHHIGNRVCEFGPFQVIPYRHNTLVTEFKIANKRFTYCTLPSSTKSKVKFSGNGTAIEIPWLNKSYVNLTASGDKLFFKWQRSVPNVQGTIIKLKLICLASNSISGRATYEYPCFQAKVLGTWSAAPTTQPPDSCVSEKRNLMFLVDGSGSVPPGTFREFKEFMIRLVKKFDIGPNTTHVGLLQYSSKPRTGLEFHFSEHQTELAVVNAINEVQYHYGAYTFGGYAMNLAQQIMNHYDRSDAKNVWVLLMDNGLWDKTRARKISKEIRQAGTKVIVLDTANIMHDIADQGMDFTSEKLDENVETVKEEICK